MGVNLRLTFKENSVNIFKNPGSREEGRQYIIWGGRNEDRLEMKAIQDSTRYWVFPYTCVCVQKLYNLQKRGLV